MVATKLNYLWNAIGHNNIWISIKKVYESFTLIDHILCYVWLNISRHNVNRFFFWKNIQKLENMYISTVISNEKAQIKTAAWTPWTLITT